MDSHTANPRPVGSLSPLQAFAQTAKPREAGPLANTLTATNGRTSAVNNASEQNAWERNLMATASLRGKIGGKCFGWFSKAAS
jgi:hypothetical protein